MLKAAAYRGAMAAWSEKPVGGGGAFQLVARVRGGVGRRLSGLRRKREARVTRASRLYR